MKQLKTDEVADLIIKLVSDDNDLLGGDSWSASKGFNSIVFINFENGQEFSLHIVEDVDD